MYRCAFCHQINQSPWKFQQCQWMKFVHVIPRQLQFVVIFSKVVLQAALLYCCSVFDTNVHIHPQARSLYSFCWKKNHRRSILWDLCDDIFGVSDQDDVEWQWPIERAFHVSVDSFCTCFIDTHFDVIISLEYLYILYLCYCFALLVCWTYSMPKIANYCHWHDMHLCRGSYLHHSSLLRYWLPQVCWPLCTFWKLGYWPWVWRPILIMG